jgi:CBS domain containing-hemolysin-like protein
MDASPDPSLAVNLLALVGLVAVNGFFVAAEFALVAARRTRLDEMAQEGHRGAALAGRAVDKLPRLISATQLGITAASLGLGWLGEPTVARLIDGWFTALPESASEFATHGVAVAIAFTIITFVHIILGELVPKGVALVHPEETACWLAPPLIAFAWLAAWPIACLDRISNLLLNALRINPSGESERLHSPEEIRMLVEQSHEGGTLHKHDARMLEGVFEFSEKTAEEVMTPRTKIVALASGLSIPDAADQVVEAELSRYPVFGKSPDDILGIVHAKDILSALRKGTTGPVGQLIRPPLFVPATKEVEDVLTDMKRLKVHMAVVLDEHGGTYGIVTMEDLLEEIVGDILDEYDEPEAVAPLDPADVVTEGSQPISEFNADNDVTLDDAHYNTVGGYVFGMIGRLPRPGDRVEAGGLMLEVIEMEGRRIKSLRVRSLGDSVAVPSRPE